jgi:hypothetical protein
MLAHPREHAAKLAVRSANAVIVTAGWKTALEVLRRQTVTFEQLQQVIGELSNEARLRLWQSCPVYHPRETLLLLDSNVSFRELRYCPRCFVAFTPDGRALNAPGRRYER